MSVESKEFMDEEIFCPLHSCNYHNNGLPESFFNQIAANKSIATGHCTSPSTKEATVLNLDVFAARNHVRMSYLFKTKAS